MASTGTGSWERKIVNVALLGLAPAAGLSIYLTSSTSVDFSLTVLLLLTAIGLLPTLLAGHRRAKAPGQQTDRTATAEPPDRPAKAEKICTPDFIETMVQEMRGPANVIQGFSEILHSPAAQDIDEAVLSSYRQFVLDNSRALSNVLVELGDMIRLDHGHIRLIEQDVDAAELAEAAIRQCRDAAENADIVIIARLYDDVELHCDAARIRQALAGIVSRAVRTAPPGSAVQVVFGRPDPGGLSISVTDKGLSVLAEDREALTTPDLTRHGLSALSLPIARRIALLHSGSLTIDSAPCAGTTVRLVLPAGRVSWPSVQEPITTRAA